MYPHGTSCSAPHCTARLVKCYAHPTFLSVYQGIAIHATDSMVNGGYTVEKIFDPLDCVDLQAHFALKYNPLRILKVSVSVYTAYQVVLPVCLCSAPALLLWCKHHHAR